MLDSCRCGPEVQISSHTLHILCPYSAEGDMCSAVEACKNCRDVAAVAENGFSESSQQMLVQVVISMLHCEMCFNDVLP